MKAEPSSLLLLLHAPLICTVDVLKYLIKSGFAFFVTLQEFNYFPSKA